MTYILTILGIVAYMVIGGLVALKASENSVFNDDLIDIVVDGIFGAFWPITLICEWILKV